MTGPQVSENFTYGGVKLTQKVISRLNTTVVKDYHGRECKIFNVEFKNGIKIAYPQQEHTGSFVETSQATYGDTKTNIYGVMGLELKGSKNRDTINVDTSEIKSIDISGDGYDEVNVKKVNGPRVDDMTPSSLNGLYNSGEIIVDSVDNTMIKNYGSEMSTRDGIKSSLHLGDGKTYQGVRRIEK